MSLYFARQSSYGVFERQFGVHSLSRMHDEKCRTPMRIARIDLVNFMIDDLVESSLGFLKRKRKKNKKKRENA